MEQSLAGTARCEGNFDGSAWEQFLCFFTALDPLSITTLTPRNEEGKLGMLPCRLKWGRAHVAINWFDLRVAQDAGPVFLANIIEGNKTERLHARRLLGRSGQKKSVRHQSRNSGQKEEARIESGSTHIALKPTPVAEAVRGDPVRRASVRL